MFKKTLKALHYASVCFLAVVVSYWTAQVGLEVAF
jgi:hypothetical protein